MSTVHFMRQSSAMEALKHRMTLDCWLLQPFVVKRSKNEEQEKEDEEDVEEPDQQSLIWLPE